MAWSNPVVVIKCQVCYLGCYHHSSKSNSNFICMLYIYNTFHGLKVFFCFCSTLGRNSAVFHCIIKGAVASFKMTEEFCPRI